MSNDVEIRVTGTNLSGRALKDAKDDTTALGTAAEKTGVKLKAEEREASSLERRLLELRATARSLGEEFKKTGDVDVFKEFNKVNRQGNALEKFTRDFKKLGSEAGQEVESLGSKLAGLADDVKIGPLPAVAALAAIPAVAAAAGAAIAGIGLAGISAGIVGAVQQAPQIGIAFTAELDKIKAAWMAGSASFVQPVLGAVKVLGAAISGLPIQKTLEGLSKYVDGIAHGVAGAITSIGQGLAYVADRAGPLLTQLGPDIASLGDAAKSALTSIADGAEGGAQALHDLVVVTGLVVEGFGKITEAAENTYGYVTDHPIAAALLTGGASVGASFWQQLLGTDTVSKLTDVTSGVGGLASTTDAFGASADYARNALKDLNDMFTSTINVALGLENANVAVAAGFADLSKAVEGHAHTLDINSDAGRSNILVVTDMISKLEQQRERTIAAGNGTQQATSQANAAFESQISQLRAVLKQLGFNTGAVDALIASLDRIPKSINTDVVIHYSEVGGSSMDKAKQQGRQEGHGGVVGAAASGGPRSGRVLVGEFGPEVADLPSGTSVHTTGDSGRLMAGMGGASQVLVKLVVDASGAGEFGRALASLLRDYVRVEGGDGSVLGITTI